MAPGGLVGPPSVRLWIDQASMVRPDSPLTGRVDTIQWQTHGYVYWMKMTEPTMWNLFVSIDRVLGRGYRYSLLVRATRHGTPMLLDHREEPQPVAEMSSIGNSRHVRMWSSMNWLSDPMELLLCGHRTRGEDGTPLSEGHEFCPS